MLTITKKKGSGPLNPIKYPAAILKKEAESIDPTSKDAEYVIKQLMHTMSTRKWGGVAGMAAPQIGFSVKIFMVQHYGQFAPKLGRRVTDGPRAYINPRIVESSDFYKAYEGCFSLEANKFDYEVERPKKLVLEYQDTEGAWHRDAFEGHFAQVIAHEYDHLEGRVCATAPKPKKKEPAKK